MTQMKEAEQQNIRFYWGQPLFAKVFRTPTNGRYSILFTVVWVDVSGGRRWWVFVLRSLPCPLPLPPRGPPLRRLLAPNLVRPLGSTAPGIHLPSVSHWHASAVARSGGSSLRRCSHFRTRIHVFSTHAHPTLQASPTAAALSDPAASVSPPSAPHARSRFCPAVSRPSTVPFFAQMVQGRAGA